MSHRLRSLASREELDVLRPIILEYFEFISAQLSEHYGVSVKPEVPVDAMFAKPHAFLPPCGQTLVAENESGVLGTVALKLLDADRVEIKRLYVRPTAQGSGLGRKLLSEAQDRARDMGAREMYLDTLKSLKPAVTLYRADGFAEVPLYSGAEIGEDPDILPHAIFMKRAL